MCWGNAGANAGINGPFDGNQDSDGYPCLDQIGRGHDLTPQLYPFPPYGPTQAFDPAYVWNNKKYATTADRDADRNGVLQGVWINNSNTAECPRCGRVIKEGRDYFVNVGPKPGYTPFPYPHPLQGVSVEVPAHLVVAP
jgi:hypothetical protein